MPSIGRMDGMAQGRRWTLIAVCATTFMLLVDITIVNVALPSVQRQLNASLTGLQWVVDAYAVTLAALILTAGTLADRYGRRFIFVIGVVTFTVASFLCGAAWNIAALDIARVLQGVGGAALFATALALIGAEYQGAARASAIAIWGATVGLAVASGPLLGGIITDSLSWRWVFFVNVPVGVFAVTLALRKLHESRDPGATHTDVAGLLTFSVALVLIVQAMLRGNNTGWSSAQIVGSLVVGVALLAAFVWIEIRQERPMLDVSLFRRPAFVGVQAGTFAIGAGMFALFPFLSIYLQDILGYSPLGAGLRFLPITVFVFFVPIATRKLSARVPMWALLSVSLAIVAAGALLMTLVSPGSTWLALLPGFIVAGLGIGLANPTIAAAALRVVDPARTGMASGISNTCRIGGLAMGVAVLGAVLESRVGSHLSGAGYHGSGLASAVSSSGLRAAGGNSTLAGVAEAAFVSGLRLVFVIGFAVVLCGSIAAAVLVRRRAKAPEAEPVPVTAR
jgi:EmrB/QacA subfamily drug resistance transporter